MSTSAKAQPINTVQKFADLIEFKALDQQDGAFKGHASVAGNLDSVGDIIPTNAYADLDELAGSGWVCGDHSWGMKDECGIILNAKEDATGLFIEAEFHSDEASQALRQKVQKRLARGKSVKMSIGFSLLKAPIYLYPHQYEKELPKYLKPGYLRDGLTRAKEFSQIRILPKIRVYECSIVSVPANQAASVSSVKSDKSANAPARISTFQLALREIEKEIIGYVVDTEFDRATELAEMSLDATATIFEGYAQRIREVTKDSPLKLKRAREAQKQRQLNRVQQQIDALKLK